MQQQQPVGRRTHNSQLYYMKGINNFSSQALMKLQTNHIMLLFFFVGGLHILEKQSNLEQQNLRDRLVQYILSLQLPNGNFTSSTLYSKLNNKSKYLKGHIVFAYSALSCLKILGALDKVDKNLILSSIGRHQKQDGSFSSFKNSSECDLRFVYSGLSICKLFDNFQHINTAKAKDYIDSCYNFDGGYGLRPKDESHSGAVYCAVASYVHLGLQFSDGKKMKTIQFLAKRQAQQEHNESGNFNQPLIGIQGRVGKKLDSCYSFWAGASLQMLAGRNLLNPEIQKFIWACYKQKQGSFSKQIENTSGDPIHTFHSITGLLILQNQVGNISLSSLTRTNKA